MRAALVLGGIVLVLEAVGLSISLPRRRWLALAYYTQLSNLMTTVSTLLLVLSGGSARFAPLRYLSVCMMVMTAFVTICVLIPMGGSAKQLLWSGNGLYHHVLCPLLTTVSYIGFEAHAPLRAAALPVLVTFAYGMAMLYCNWRGAVDGPYPFFRVRKQSARATALWVAALLLAAGAIALLVWAVAR